MRIHTFSIIKGLDRENGKEIAYVQAYNNVFGQMAVIPITKELYLQIGSEMKWSNK